MATIDNVSIKKWGWLAKKLNEIIKVLNALQNLSTSSPDGGKLTIGDSNAVLDHGLQEITLELCDGSTITVYGRRNT